MEAYIFPTTKPQPPGTVELCSKYARRPRDDCIVFPGTRTNGQTCGDGDAYMRDQEGNLINDYVDPAGPNGTDWIGWV
jgi:hypothetical protein